MTDKVYCDECMFFVKGPPYGKKRYAKCGLTRRDYVSRQLGRDDLNYCSIENPDGECKQFVASEKPVRFGKLIKIVEIFRGLHPQQRRAQ